MTSPKQQERGNALSSLPLSRTMRDLLSTLVLAIDRRVNIINALGEGETEYEPESCDACGGTGLIMVQTAVLVDRSDEPDESVHGGRSHVPHRNSDNSDVGNYTEDMVAALNLPVKEASGSGARTYANAAAATAVVTPAVAPAVFVSPTAQQTASSVTRTSFVPVAQPSNSTASVGVQAIVPTQPAGSSATAVAATTVATAVSPNGAVPAPSTVIPGLDALGPNHPVPAPEDAVFAVAGGDRYYAVTKGIRVGVFGGWLNTTAYVTGVPSAAHSKNPTIEAAYADYCRAYGLGLVSYV